MPPARQARLVELGDSREDQPLARAGHGHVEQPVLLGGVGLGELERDEGRPGRAGLLAELVGELEAHPQVGVERRAARVPAARLAAEVGHGYHRELQALRGVDGQDAHRLPRLDGRAGLPLGRRGGDGPRPAEVVGGGGQTSRVRREALGLGHEAPEVGVLGEPAPAGQDLLEVAGFGGDELDDRRGRGVPGHAPGLGEQSGGGLDGSKIGGGELSNFRGRGLKFMPCGRRPEGVNFGLSPDSLSPERLGIWAA